MSTSALQIIGSVLIATFDLSTAAWKHFTFIFPGAFGFGGALTILLIALLSSVPSEGLSLQYKPD